MPSLCDSTDFGLTNEAANRKFRLQLERKHPTLLQDLGSGLALYQHGSEKDGAYFVVGNDLIAYYMRYKAMKKNLVGAQSVTQTAVWQSLSAPLPSGFVLSMVFDILLKKYPAVVSDRIQTAEGKNLWVRLMGLALSKGYSVSLLDFSANTKHPIQSEAELRLWSTDESGAWAFKSRRHENLRFLIYKKD